MYIIHADAHLRLWSGVVEVLDRPHLPVVELARALNGWLEVEDRDDVAFESQSYEDTGVVTVRSVGDEWTIGSVWVAEVANQASWVVEEAVLRQFISQVASDLTGLGVDATRAVSSGLAV